MGNLAVIGKQSILGQRFTLYGTFEEPLFLAQDVAAWIEYNKNQVGKMLKTIDDEEKLTDTIVRSGQAREMWFLTEDGLYEVLFQSRKPIAKVFKRAIKDLLKGLRRGEIRLQSHKQTEEYQLTLSDSKENQKKQMSLIGRALPKENYIKPNTIANKAVAIMYGIEGKLKKDDMTAEQLVHHAVFLQKAVALITAQKMGVPIESVSKLVYSQIPEIKRLMLPAK